jgi:hypothetical protein
MIPIFGPAGSDGVETGLPMCPSEKKAPNIASGVQRDTFSSPVFQQNVPNCGHFAPFSENVEGFLCITDCVAEQAGFELSVPF